MDCKYIFLNGELVEAEQAKLHVSDLSIQRGYGIFDFLKTIDFHPVFIDDYLNRFYNSAAAMHLNIPIDRVALKAQIRLMIEKNGIANSGIKLILTGGYSPNGYTLAQQANFTMVQSPLVLDPNTFKKGLSLLSHNFQRQEPEVKTIDYLQAIKNWHKIVEQGADDFLYHQNSQVRECPRANVFMVKGNTVYTPKTAILRGITRSKVLGLKPDGLEIIEKDFELRDLAAADEAFVTVTTKNICPILRLDGQAIKNGEIGPITQQLNQLLQNLIVEDIQSKKGFNF